MITAAAVALSLALSQDPDAAPPAEPPPVVEDAPAPAAVPAGPPRPKGADEALKLMQKLASMSPEERLAAVEAIQKQYGAVDSNPVLPGPDVDLQKYAALSVEQQVEVNARGFFNDVIAGDTNRLVSRCGFPFFMEARRIDRADELRAQWGKTLRSRRADLLKLYSIEVLLPADMEKKYGKPPARLSPWSWRAANTYIAVGNLSGHATLLLLRQAGAAWQVVGFHD